MIMSHGKCGMQGGVAFTCMLLIFLVASTIVSGEKAIKEKEKHVIGCVRSGFFANFFTVLNHLLWCEENNKTAVVYWDKESLYHDSRGYNGSNNVWEYYFTPVSKENYKLGDIIHRSPVTPDGRRYLFQYYNRLDDGKKRECEHYVRQNLIKKYIVIKPCVMDKIDEFYNKHMKGKKTVGIHLRGTDKEFIPISLGTLFEQANKHSPCQFYVAADTHEFIKEAKKCLRGKIITYDCCRSSSSTPIHYQKPRNYSKAKMGEDVLAEVLLLSRCDAFFYNQPNSYTTRAVLFFNPEIDLQGMSTIHYQPVLRPKKQ